MPDLLAKLAKTLEHTRQLWTVRYSPCGQFLFAAGYDALIHRWDVSAAEPRRLDSLAGHQGWTQRIAFAGEMLLTADSWGRLIAWKYAAEQPQPIWNVEQALAGWIRALAISPDGTMVAVSGCDPSVKLYSIADGKQIAELGGHPTDVYSVAFHPDGKSLVSGDLKGTLRHWDVATKKVVRQIEAPMLYRVDRLQDCGGVRHLSFDTSGKQLLCGGMKNPGGGFAEGAPVLLVLDWDAGVIAHELQHGDKNDGFVYDAAFHPSGFVMATCCAMPGKGQLWFWRIGEPKPYFVSTDLPNGRGLSLHPDGKRLALVTSVAVNANGRPQGDKYVDGTAKIQLLDLV
jgi:WD40 repeat protein